MPLKKPANIVYDTYLDEVRFHFPKGPRPTDFTMSIDQIGTMILRIRNGLKDYATRDDWQKHLDMYTYALHVWAKDFPAEAKVRIRKPEMLIAEEIHLLREERNG